ncbi:hypothetical protein [Glycomyces rhizosphaerae]|uniref:Uncharacterized protein n=1 Tax=Glycomyces rhizosphaerae TaxID=2054422 RepID=A0ABV7PUZ8_9ACTN
MTSIPEKQSSESDERQPASETAVVFGGLRGELDVDDRVFDVDPDIQRMAGDE